MKWNFKRNKLCIVLSMIVICIFILNGGPLYAEENQSEKINDPETSIMDQLQLDEINDYWKQIGDQYGSYLPDLTRKNLGELIKSNETISIKSFLMGIVKFLLYELIENGQLLGTLIIVTLFSVILQAIHSAFERAVVSKVAYFVVYIVLIYIALNSFYTVFTYAKETVVMMSNFLIALLPLMLGLIATFGQLISVSFFHPIIIFLIHISGILVANFIFPLLYLSALLIIISNLNDHFQATHLADLFKNIALATLGVFLTIFIGVMSVQGTVTAIQDGVALKTTKFITGNFIPVVGRTFTDAADTVLSASLLLKNAIGLVGVTIVILIAIFPALKIAVIALIYKLAAALLQPLGKSPIIVSLNTISQHIMYVLASLITVTFMFFLSIVMITIASNIPLLIK